MKHRFSIPALHRLSNFSVPCSLFDVPCPCAPRFQLFPRLVAGGWWLDLTERGCPHPQPPGQKTALKPARNPADVTRCGWDSRAPKAGNVRLANQLVCPQMSRIIADFIGYFGVHL
jgi:hypothetical protein